MTYDQATMGVNSGTVIVRFVFALVGGGVQRCFPTDLQIPLVTCLFRTMVIESVGWGPASIAMNTCFIFRFIPMMKCRH